MARKSAQGQTVQKNVTIRLPIMQDKYQEIVSRPSLFREWVSEQFVINPELFPNNFGEGYLMKDILKSSKLEIRYRRITLRDKRICTIYPSFVMPYMTSFTNEISTILFLSRWVPCWALAKVYHTNPAKIYRMINAFGRYNIVAATVKTASLPEHLSADEYHATRRGEKGYVAVTGADGVVLGCEFCETASEESLTEGYGVCQKESLQVKPDYQPKTVNTDGWAATIQAWKTLFPAITTILCFLHSWIKIRSCSKSLKGLYFEIGKRVWEIYKSAEASVMSLHINELRDWATKNLTGTVLGKVIALCDKENEWQKHLKHPACRRTSNSLDRMMRFLNRYVERGQGFHGSTQVTNLRCRAWALLYNYHDWSPTTRKDNKNFRCPAERFNEKRYAEDWLENLIVATSCAPQNVK